MPASSKTEPPLAKAKTISNGGSASVIFKKGKKKNLAVKRQWGERSETMWKKQLCRHQGQWRRRERRCSRCWSRKSSLAARAEDHGEADCAPAVHGGPWWSRSPPVAHGRDPTLVQVDVWRRLWPHGEPVLEQAPAMTYATMERGAHAGAGLLAGLVTPWGTHAGAACSWRTAPRGKDPCWGSSSRAAACGKDSRWRSLWRTVSHERDLRLEQGKSVRSPHPEEERVAETTCDELTAAPIPRPPVLLMGRGRETGVKLSLGRREGWGKVF